MRIIPIDNIADDGAYCDGCGQTLVHGESALVPDRELAHEEPETQEAERVQDCAFALCLGCTSNAADVLAAHGSEERQRAVPRAVYLALRDLRASLPLLTGRVITPAEQIVLDAAAAFAAKYAKRKLVVGSSSADLMHAIKLARAQGWKP